MSKCIICGKEEDVLEYKLPHGTVHLCHSDKCSRLITYRLNQSCPIVWVGEAELLDEYENDALNEALPNLTEEEILQAARDATEALWSDDIMGNMFHDAIEIAQRYLEEARIKATPLEKLPLMIDKAYYSPNNELIKERLKDGK